MERVHNKREYMKSIKDKEKEFIRRLNRRITREIYGKNAI